MKIKIKMIIFMIILTLVPIIVISVLNNSNTKEVALRAKYEMIEFGLNRQADDINYVFQNIIAISRRMIGDETVRQFVVDSNNPAVGINEDVQAVINSDLYKLTTVFRPAVSQAMIINESGTIIACSESNDVGKKREDYDLLVQQTEGNNGFSPLVMLEDESGAQMIGFTVAKAIVYDDGQRHGIFYQFYSIAIIQPFLSSSRFDIYTTAAIMDREGNILEYPFRHSRSYDDNVSFADASGIIGAVLEQGDLDSLVIAECGSRINRLFGIMPVQIGGYYIISITNIDSAVSGLIGSQGSVIPIILIVICTAAIVLLATKFTRPVSDIIKVIDAKQKGRFVRFEAKADEFKFMCDSLNHLFDQLVEDERRCRAIVEMSDNIQFEITLRDNRVLMSNDFNKKFSFRPKDDSFDESFFCKLRVHKDDKSRYDRDLNKIMGSEKNFSGEYRIKNIYGDFSWFLIRCIKFYDNDETPKKIVGVITDIDRERKSQDALFKRANIDSLTNINNREHFLSLLGTALENSYNNKTLDAVMFIDLDDFKGFNDNYSHACGDEVLKFVADTLKEITFERGFPGRFGGDEFVICLTGLSVFGDAGKVAKDIIDILADGFDFDHEGTMTHHAVRCSIGIAFLMENGKNIEEIMAAADMAMYDIKKRGKSNFAYARSNINSKDTDHINNSTSEIANREEETS